MTYFRLFFVTCTRFWSGLPSAWYPLACGMPGVLHGGDNQSGALKSPLGSSQIPWQQQLASHLRLCPAWETPRQTKCPDSATPRVSMHNARSGSLVSASCTVMAMVGLPPPKAFRSHPGAPPKRVGSQPVATPKPPRCVPHACLMRPRCVPEAPPMRPQSSYIAASKPPANGPGWGWAGLASGAVTTLNSTRVAL
jgi:hypothetical protein